MTDIVVTHERGQWVAWFLGSPETAFGGDSPARAVERLWATADPHQTDLYPASP